MQDRITQILQQMNEMSDEPIRMQDGGTVDDNTTNVTNPFTQVYGQRRSTPFSLDEYLRGSMYDFAGIDVSATPSLDEDGDDEDQDPPNILTSVSEPTDDATEVFRGVSLTTGQYGVGYSVADLNPGDYLNKILNQESFTIKEDGFSKYAQQEFMRGGGVPTAVAGLAMGVPGLSFLAAGAAALAEKRNKKNAEAIMQSGGGAGDLFTLNGATVSRAPGERIFTGNLGNFSQSQLYSAREMDFGFIPGSMKETVTQAQIGMGPQGLPRTSRTGLGGVEAAGSVPGHIMDAFGVIHTVRDSDTGHMNVSAGAAQKLRENEFRNVMAAQGIDVNKQFTDSKGNFSRSAFTMAAVDYKQFVDRQMKGHPSHKGFFHSSNRLNPNEYASAMAFRNTISSNYVKDKYGLTTAPVKTDSGDAPPPASEPKVPPPKTEPTVPSGGIMTEAEPMVPSGGIMTEAEPMVPDRNRDDNVGGGIMTEAEPMVSSEDSGGSGYGGGGGFGGGGYDGGYGYGGGDAYGGVITPGRVGMAAGDTPQGTFEPGFVKGPPENFTERETVADDQNGKVKPDTFIINAAAVEIAGSEDIRKMLMKAYEVAVQKGLDIGRVDRKLYEGTVDVALSKGEVVVPPELAKIIGYDRLRKINNRGKKEVASRQKKAGGGFLDGKKDGGEVTRPTPKPSLVERRKDEALADVELRADLEAYIKEDKLARLGWDLYSKGEIDMTGVMLRNPKTGQDYGSSNYSGFYFPKKGQEMYPGPVEIAKADTDQTVMPRLGVMQSGKAIRTDIPSIYYYGEKNPALQIRRDKDGNIVNTPQEMSRAGVFLTMAHELRHAALNYIHNEGGVKNVIGTPRAEERLMDYYDYHNRRIAAASDSSVPKTDPVPGSAGRQEFASYDHMQKELNEYYENIAAAALKGRKVPPRAKRIKKNFFEKFINELFD